MILGLDCSSRTIHGVVLNDKEEIVTQFKTDKYKEDFDIRFVKIADNFDKILSKIKVEKAFVEAAIYIQNPKSTIEIARVVGGVQLICNKYRTPCQLVDNTKWKKEVVGKGNCSKANIMSFAIEKWGDSFEEQDFADAACIALYGLKEGKENGNTQ
jgi:Holliday junction resolvasome RuvABC endonuclease subunit